LTQTPLDRAHEAMQAAPEDDRARLGFFGRLADVELFVLLAAEPGDERLDPEIFAVEGNRYVLAFDHEERLVAFAGRPAPYAALPGRVLAAMLAGQGLGLGLNIGAPSETLLPAEALAWLAETLGQEGPAEELARPEEIRPPARLPAALIEALAVKLALAAGLARAAWLAGVSYQDGRRGHLLAFVGAAPGAEAALARAVSEALVFSGIEAGALDVAFLETDDPIAADFGKVGLGFAIPEPAAAQAPRAPGGDPARPPRLR
jgi:hypothetical protein